MVECVSLDPLRPHRRLLHFRNICRATRLRFCLDRPSRQSSDSVRSPPLDRSNLSPAPPTPTSNAKIDPSQTDDHTNITPPRLFILQRHPLSPPAHAPPQQPPQDGHLVLLHLRRAIPELRPPRPRRLRRLFPVRHPPRLAPRRMPPGHARRALAGRQ